MVSLPTTEDPILQEPSRVLLHQRPRGAFLHVGGFGWPGCGPRTGSCCCSCCRSAISVGEARCSGPLELPQCRTAPLHCPSASRRLLYTVCRCLQTAPLHCLLVGVSLLLSILLAAARFVGEWGKRDAAGQRTGFNTLDNWGHKTPTQSERIKDRKEKIKGSWPPEHVYNTLGYIPPYSIIASVLAD